MYCSNGTVFIKSFFSVLFIKSFDTFNAPKTAELFYGLFREVVLEIGLQYVIQFIIDNAANYVAAGKMLWQDSLHLHCPTCLND